MDGTKCNHLNLLSKHPVLVNGFSKDSRCRILFHESQFRVLISVVGLRTSGLTEKM